VKYERPCHDRTTHRLVKYREYQCRAYQTKSCSITEIRNPARISYPADEVIGRGEWCEEIRGFVVTTHYLCIDLKKWL